MGGQYSFFRRFGSNWIIVHVAHAIHQFNMHIFRSCCLPNGISCYNWCNSWLDRVQIKTHGKKRRAEEALDPCECVPHIITKTLAATAARAARAEMWFQKKSNCFYIVPKQCILVCLTVLYRTHNWHKHTNIHTHVRRTTSTYKTTQIHSIENRNKKNRQLKAITCNDMQCMCLVSFSLHISCRSVC